MKDNNIINDKANNEYDKILIEVQRNKIRRGLRKHFKNIGFSINEHGKFNIPNFNKETIRSSHLDQRWQKIRASKSLLKNFSKYIEYFASGKDVSPQNILPRIELIASDTKESDLFKIASLTWSIPVSAGYGRRMRFLVWDDNNGKLMGIFALGDPIFNLRVRDDTIGWTATDRRQRLVNLMDAYVLGALPPYNMLLGGKLVCCLIRTKEVRDLFSFKYADAEGIISGKKKHANLLAVTTTSALGRSSVYNRLQLNGRKYFESIGYTQGYGHFHIPDSLFARIREYLELLGHSYSDNYNYGNGANWKLRAVKKALSSVGMDDGLIHHGIKREVFLCQLASNASSYLKGESKKPDFGDLLSVRDVGQLALERWVCPRAIRRPEYTNWNRETIKEVIAGKLQHE